jgi:hypothetical protein
LRSSHSPQPIAAKSASRRLRMAREMGMVEGRVEVGGAGAGAPNRAGAERRPTCGGCSAHPAASWRCTIAAAIGGLQDRWKSNLHALAACRR